MRELQRSRDRKILGVAGGFAEYFDMDKTIWRAIWVFGCIAMPPAILAYFILGMVLPDAAAPRFETPPRPQEPPRYEAPPAADPEPQPVYTRSPYKPLTKSRDRWLAGVCGGVADYFAVDPLLIRALWLAAVFAFGTGLLIYIVLAILMPEPHRQFPR